MQGQSKLTKLGYGTGQGVLSALDTTHLYYFVPFFVVAMGVPGSLVGLASLIGVLIDAAFDPLIGRYSDHYHSRRWGRRHLFMVVGAPLLAVFLVLLFNPPAGLSVTGIFVWLLVFTTLARISMSVNYVPYLSLGAELSSDYDERTSIANYRNFFGFALGTSLSFFLWLVFIHPSARYPTGWTDPVAYGKFGALAAVIATVGGLVAAFATFRQIPRLPQPPPESHESRWYSAYTDIARACRLPSFRYVVGGWMGFMTLYGAHAAILTTVNGYYWGLTSSQQFLSVAAYSIATVPGTILAAVLCRRYEKRTAAIVGLVGFVGFHLLLYTADILRILPPRGTPALIAVMISFLTVALTFMISLNVTVYSMMADVADDLHLHAGERQEGVVFAATSFGQKLTNGFGGLISGVGLDLIGFSGHAAQSVVPADVLGRLGILMGFVLPGFVIIPAFLFARYRLDRACLRTIQARLAHSEPAMAPSATLLM